MVSLRVAVCGIAHRLRQAPSTLRYIFVPRDWLEAILAKLAETPHGWGDLTAHDLQGWTPPGEPAVTADDVRWLERALTPEPIGEHLDD